MRITEITITLADSLSHRNKRLLAYASIVLDGGIAIRDLRIIEGQSGTFVAMPSRRQYDHCPECHNKTSVTARFCDRCGVRLADDRAEHLPDGRVRLYSNVVFPINSEARERLTSQILDAYRRDRGRRDDAA